jgi:hypothetical protein
MNFRSKTSALITISKEIKLKKLLIHSEITIDNVISETLGIT